MQRALDGSVTDTHILPFLCSLSVVYFSILCLEKTTLLFLSESTFSISCPGKWLLWKAFAEQVLHRNQEYFSLLAHLFLHNPSSRWWSFPFSKPWLLISRRSLKTSISCFTHFIYFIEYQLCWESILNVVQLSAKKEEHHWGSMHAWLHSIYSYTYM